LRIAFEPGRIEHLAGTIVSGSIEVYFGGERVAERSIRDDFGM